MITIPFATYRPHLVLMTRGIIDVLDPDPRYFPPQLRVGDVVHHDGRPYGVVLERPQNDGRVRLLLV